MFAVYKIIFALSLSAAMTLTLPGCKASSLPVQTLPEKPAVSFAELKASAARGPGPIHMQKVVASDWQISRAGLIDLSDPKAKAEGLQDGDEPIQIYFYVLDHPQYGRFFIDSGVGDLFTRRDAEPQSPFSGILWRMPTLVDMRVEQSTSQWLKAHGPAPQAIFLTHLHFDHILGLSDLPKDSPAIVGSGEADERRLANFLLQKMTNGLIGWSRPLQEIAFPPAAEGSPLSAIDWFGDQSLFVIYVPGHTAGSLAFLVNSTEGPQLIVGDTSHTAWGWRNKVPPGTFSDFAEENRNSLNALVELSQGLPVVHVHPGHQKTID